MKLQIKYLVFFLMLPHFLISMAGVGYIWPAVVIKAFNVGRLVSSVVIILLYILKNRLPSTPVWLLAALQGWLLFVTYVQAKGNVHNAWLYSLSILAVALLVDFFSSNIRVLLSGLILNLEILIYVNLLSVLMFYPDGMFRVQGSGYPYYFLGYHNDFIVYVLPTVVIALLYALITQKRLRSCLLIGAGILSICITWSATSICGLLAFLLVLILGNTAIKKRITYQAIFVVTITVDLLISVFRVMDRIAWMVAFIESFLKKQVTLTGRTFIWDSFYLYFSQSPWIGYGKNTRIFFALGFSAPHVHNTWFQCLFEGGIPALLLFLAFNFVVGKQQANQKEKMPVIIFLGMFAALYVIYIAETYLSSPWFYMLYILAYHVDKFEAVPTAHRKKFRLVKRGYHVQNRKFLEKH